MFRNGLEVGGFASVFYQRDSSYYDNGVDDSYWVEMPRGPMVPSYHQGAPQQNAFKSELFDVTQGQQSVKWGSLATLGLATDHHSLNFVYLYTRATSDTATLAQDTRSKQYYFPGYDPTDFTSPGHDHPDAAPYTRLETLEYTERTTETFQINGRSEFDVGKIGIFSKPELSWTLAHSTAGLNQPDKRQFGAFWQPGRQAGPLTLPGTWYPDKPAANFSLGNLQRIWKQIDETSNQYSADLKLPFKQWSENEGYVKVGVFGDKLERKFNQDSFSNFNDNSSSPGEFDQPWSAVFPYEDHTIRQSEYDVDYDGDQRINAWYAMMKLPVNSQIDLIGGARLEKTKIGVVNHPGPSATWFPPDSNTETDLNPGDADVNFSQTDVLPAVSVEYRPVESVTLRGAYSQTVARQTFKELTPILQQEYLGGPIFIGNPDLQMSNVTNYDLRVDYTPYEGGFFSASWFKKDIEDPIEYERKIVPSFDYTTAVNYPSGRLNGFELETRQSLGHFWDPLEGLSIGANATFIDSQVTLSKEKQAEFDLPNIRAPQSTRDMTGAPDYLFNLYTTYTIAASGTEFGLFYNYQGDTLVAGGGQANGRFVPDVYTARYGTLNFNVAQAIGKYVRLQFQAKNLTNPDIQTVYRSIYIGDDVTKTSYSKGIDFSFSLGGQVTF